MTIPQRALGPWKVSAMGLGGMPLSGMPAEKAAILNDRQGAIGVVHAALDAGVTLIDTADIYSPSWDTFGHNELLIGEAFRSWSGSQEAKLNVVIATKGGITRGPKESWGRCGSRDYFLRAAEASALRLGVEKIQLWQHHRLDPSMPFETQFENVLVLLERGLVERIGVSNYNAEQLRRAINIGGTPAQGGVVSIQNEFSPNYRHATQVHEVCEENGIAFLAYSPFSGVNSSKLMGEGKYGDFAKVGASRNLSAYAIGIAWLLKVSPSIIPIPGATRIASVLDSLSGVSVELTDDEMERLNTSLPENSPVDGDLLEQPPFI